MKKSKILIVDDDIAILDSLRRNLFEEFEVVTHQSAYEALSEVEQDKTFKVILSDYKMTGMNGLDFLIITKRISPLSRRILLTGYADLQIAMEAVNRGMVYRFLTKPSKTENIIKIIKSAVVQYNLELEQKQRATSNEYLALHDTMTGLMNRTGLLDRLEQGRALAKRSQRQLALLFLDLNKFKQINDTAGHAVGDRILVEVSSRLKKLFRATDTVARWGGDEFLVVLPDLSRSSAISVVLENIVTEIERPYIIDEQHHTLGVSIGISMYPFDSTEPDELISQADKAMYTAKERSKKTGSSAYSFAADLTLRDDTLDSIPPLF